MGRWPLQHLASWGPKGREDGRLAWEAAGGFGEAPSWPGASAAGWPWSCACLCRRLRGRTGGLSSGTLAPRCGCLGPWFPHPSEDTCSAAQPAHCPPHFLTGPSLEVLNNNMTKSFPVKGIGSPRVSPRGSSAQWVEVPGCPLSFGRGRFCVAPLCFPDVMTTAPFAHDALVIALANAGKAQSRPSLLFL